ncbi:hypothetical protein ZWY2020_053921 [Hordeum vulgare]|nr:hypothetical protein ZWY2020_053921 [Hordeum vulgare]
MWLTASPSLAQTSAYLWATVGIGIDDLAEGLERRAGGHPALVHGCGEHKGGEGKRDAGNGYAKAKAPADVLLNLDEEHAGDDRTEAHAEVEPAEEGRLALPVHRAVVVKLLCAEWQQRRPHPAAPAHPIAMRYSPTKATVCELSAHVPVVPAHDAPTAQRQSQRVQLNH